jgi:FlaA1/EpsC-like NDP-sugar epimerase
MRVFAQVADILMTMVSFVTAFQLRSQIRTIYFFGSAQSAQSYYNILIFVIVLWWFLLDVQKAYSAFQRQSLWHDLKRVMRTVIFGTLALLATGYVMRLELPPRSTIALFVILNTVLLLLNRVFLHSVREYLRVEGGFTRTNLIVGAGEKAQRFLGSAAAHPEWDLDLLGFIELDHLKVGRDVMGAKVLGTPGDLPRILHEHPIQEVIFAVSTRQLEECTDMLALCEQEGVNAVILSNFFSSLVAQVDTEILYDQPVLTYRTTKQEEWQLLVKRVFDIAFSATLLLVLAPVMIAAALAMTVGCVGPWLISLLGVK